MLVDQKTIVGEIYRGVDQVADLGADALLLGLFGRHQAAGLRCGRRQEGARLISAGRPAPTAFAPRTARSSRSRSRPTARTRTACRRSSTCRRRSSRPASTPRSRISDWPSFSTGYVQKSQHQIALLGWLNIVDPDRLLFSQLTTNGPLNWGKYSNPELDEALAAGPSGADDRRPHRRPTGRRRRSSRRRCPITSSPIRAISCSTPRRSAR